ncbi:hypothetical protein AMECASPLE_020453, partial [Ameca splendens]
VVFALRHLPATLHVLTATVGVRCLIRFSAGWFQLIGASILFGSGPGWEHSICRCSNSCRTSPLTKGFLSS